MSALTGTLTHAGNMDVGDDKDVCGLFVTCERPTLIAAKSLPMYKAVTVIASDELAQLRSAEKRCDGLLAVFKEATADREHQFEVGQAALMKRVAELEVVVARQSSIGAEIIELSDGPSEINACRENIARYEAAVEEWRCLAPQAVCDKLAEKEKEINLIENDRLAQESACMRATERAEKAERELAKLTCKSDQHTCCAVCGKDKHTPLRNDNMGGYVCLTCIDKELIKQADLIHGLNLIQQGATVELAKLRKDGERLAFIKENYANAIHYCCRVAGDLWNTDFYGTLDRAMDQVAKRKAAIVATEGGK